MEDQLKVDPTGVLSKFWIEQRRMLKKHTQKRWDPEVNERTIYVCTVSNVNQYVCERERDRYYGTVCSCGYVWVTPSSTIYDPTKEVS